MPYSSNLTDCEWEILEPLLHKILPIKKPTRPPNWTKIQILDGICYQLKNGGNWEDLPKDLPPYSTVYWYYQQWRAQGVLEELMRVLHSQVREQVKKTKMDYVDDYRFTGCQKYLQCQYCIAHGIVFINLPMVLKGI